MNRRQLLTGIVASVPLLSGCSTLLDSLDTAQTPTTTPTPTATTAGTEATTTLTPTPTTTPTATPPPTATPTPTALPTSTATVTPFPTVTTVDGTIGTDGGSLDFSSLTTYTGKQYPFSVKYPTGWITKPSNVTGGVVQFLHPSGGGLVLVQALDTLPPAISLEKLTNNYVTGITGGDPSARLGQRDVTLSNGTPAKIVTTKLMYTNPPQTVRNTSVVTIANGTGYFVSVMVPVKRVTPAIKKGIEKILLSLTIR